MRVPGKKSRLLDVTVHVGSGAHSLFIRLFADLELSRGFSAYGACAVCPDVTVDFVRSARVDLTVIPSAWAVGCSRRFADVSGLRCLD